MIRFLTVGVLLLGLACGPSQAELDSALARDRELQTSLEASEQHQRELDARIGELHAERERLAERLRSLGQEVEGLQDERSTLTTTLADRERALEELRARERQAEERLATFRTLLSRFRAMIESGRLRVRVVRNRMVVELPEGILFDSGQADLKDEGQVTLTEVASVLTTITGREFQIAGHTDNVPLGRRARFRDNWELSAARATNVARFLVSQGVAAQRISAAGYADTQPSADNGTDSGRAQNRRIEIVLVPNLDELPDLSSIAGM